MSLSLNVSKIFKKMSNYGVCVLKSYSRTLYNFTIKFLKNVKKLFINSRLFVIIYPGKTIY